MKKILPLEKVTETQLLSIWLNNANCIYTQGEEKLLTTCFHQFPEEMFTFAIILYEQEKDASVLLDIVRNNKLIELIRKMTNMPINEKDINIIQQDIFPFIEKIIEEDKKNELYILDEEDCRDRSLHVFPRLNKTPLTARNVRSVYRDICFWANDFTEEMPNEDFLFPSSLYQTCLIKAKKAKEHAADIISMIQEVKGIDEGIKLFDIGIRQDGSIWTANDTLMDILFLLGLTNNSLEVQGNVPREEWSDNFERGIPIIQKTKTPQPVKVYKKELYNQIIG